ncbi:MAG: hypothetical protein CMJ48_08515 [Planctomycetaceae bacterium]|nr:hypothetical protein [Planctomycetaceae bacterium]
MSTEVPMLRLLHVALIAGMLANNSGCLIMGSNQRVTRDSEPLRRVRFESAVAQSTFQAAALDNSARIESGSSFSLAVPFLMSVGHSQVRSQNAYYNDLAARVDTNRDGVISDVEVRVLPAMNLNDNSPQVAQQPGPQLAEPLAPIQLQPISAPVPAPEP